MLGLKWQVSSLNARMSQNSIRIAAARDRPPSTRRYKDLACSSGSLLLQGQKTMKTTDNSYWFWSWNNWRASPPHNLVIANMFPYNINYDRVPNINWKIPPKSRKLRWVKPFDIVSNPPLSVNWLAWLIMRLLMTTLLCPGSWSAGLWNQKVSRFYWKIRRIATSSKNFPLAYLSRSKYKKNQSYLVDG